MLNMVQIDSNGFREVPKNSRRCKDLPLLFSFNYLLQRSCTYSKMTLINGLIKAELREIKKTKVGLLNMEKKSKNLSG